MGEGGSSVPTAPEGWYPDPDRPGGQRYFDGNAWTEHRTDPPMIPGQPMPRWLPPTPETLERRRKNRRFALIFGAVVGAVLVALTVIGVLTSSDKASAAGAQDVCEQAVRQDLRVPSTASFDPSPAITHDGNRYTVSGYVDAQNGFGAKIRGYYHCQATWLHGKTWHIDSANASPSQAG